MDSIQVSVCGLFYCISSIFTSPGGGRRRGNNKQENGTGGLNRGNTIIAPGYGGMRHYLNQIPYVTPPSQSEYVEWFSR